VSQRSGWNYRMRRGWNYRSAAVGTTVCVTFPRYQTLERIMWLFAAQSSEHDFMKQTAILSSSGTSSFPCTDVWCPSVAGHMQPL
jgi:hypothetical protein